MGVGEKKLRELCKKHHIPDEAILSIIDFFPKGSPQFLETKFQKFLEILKIVYREKKFKESMFKKNITVEQQSEDKKVIGIKKYS